MNLPFVKMSGAGNDFILFENLPLQTAKRLAPKLCDRRRGIGADGLLLVKKAPVPRLDYLNSDGSIAFCGNGSRCAAWWMFHKKWVASRSFEFQTSAGLLKAEMTKPKRAAIRMPKPHSLKLGLFLKAEGHSWPVHFLNTGVPHAVIPVKNLDSFPVPRLGRLFRFHKSFLPQGANIDFIEMSGNTLYMRTYERGVEDETLACGTGAVASAAVALLTQNLKSPVKIVARSGDTLKVFFKPGPHLPNPVFQEAWLEGPVQVTFQGEINL